MPDVTLDLDRGLIGHLVFVVSGSLSPGRFWFCTLAGVSRCKTQNLHQAHVREPVTCSREPAKLAVKPLFAVPRRARTPFFCLRARHTCVRTPSNATSPGSHPAMEIFLQINLVYKINLFIFASDLMLNRCATGGGESGKGRLAMDNNKVNKQKHPQQWKTFLLKTASA